MKPLTVKQSQRLEKKKKKMAAFLEIAKLNDKDREAKETKLRAREELTSESSDSENGAAEKMPPGEPSRKRAKKYHDVKMDDTPTPAAGPTEGDACAHGSPAAPESASVGPRGKELLSGQEYQDLRRRLRERKRLLKNLPLIRLKQIGESASIDLGEDDRTPLFLSDVQHLLLYSILGNNAPYNPLAWCHIEKAKSISQTVFLLIEGISLYDFQAYQSSFPTLTSCFSTKLEVITPSAYKGSFVEELSLVPLTHAKEIKLLKQYGNIEAAMRADGEIHKVLRAIFPVLETDSTGAVIKDSTGAVTEESTDVVIEDATGTVVEDASPKPEYSSLWHLDQFSRTQLIMSVPQLMDQSFPIPVKGPLKEKYKNYILTKDLYSEVTPQSPMFALDCEMCMTTKRQLELTRISIVDEHMKCIYDTLVLPYCKIINYLTQYSGITPEMLKNVTKRLEDVQEDLRQMLPMDAILIGQSLNSDLHTIKMMHPYVIDTSVIFNITGNYKRKTKLATLSLKFLGEEIQSSSALGHCSTEDSEACMKLVQLKLANNLAFGDTVLASRQPEFRSLTQSMVTLSSPAIKAAWNEVLPQTVSEPQLPVPQTVSEPQPPPPEKSYPQYENLEQAEHLASSMFNYFKHHEKSVAIVSTRAIIDEYSSWINSRLTASRKKNKKAVECLAATSKENVILKMGGAASKHALTLGHLAYDAHELDDKADKVGVFREVDAWCGQVWEKMAPNGLCLIMLGGRQGGANGLCFMRLKRRDSAPFVNQDHNL